MQPQDDKPSKKPRVSSQGQGLSSPPGQTTAERLSQIEQRLQKLESAASTASGTVSSQAGFEVALLDPTARIPVDRFVVGVAKALQIASQDQDLSPGTPFSPEELIRRLNRYWDISQPMMEVLRVGGRWGREEHTSLWSRVIERLGEPGEPRNGIAVWLVLERWPAVLAQYSAGLAATIAGNYLSLRAVLQDPSIEQQGRSAAAAVALDPPAVLDAGALKSIADYARRHTPVSDYLHEHFLPLFEDDLGSPRSFDKAFDDFEFFKGLVHIDLSGRTGWAPIGRFGWRRERYESVDPLRRTKESLESAKEGWPPIKAGFFGGSWERASTALSAYGEIVQRTSPLFF